MIKYINKTLIEKLAKQYLSFYFFLMIYKYKMQWMFNYETAKKVLPIIGAQSLDNIRVRDARNLRI